ncbi:MAG: hypothetical protein WC600_15235 [Desulfobaccales bacterium]
MRSKVIILTLALLMAPGISSAEHPGRGHMMGGKGMSQCAMGNMDMMNQMTNEMHQMMGQGHMTPVHQKQMQGMMDQMDQMKQQMAGPQNPQMEQQQRQQLQQMQRRLNTIKQQWEHQH